MKNFYLGVDIGTDSVGIACTDEQYNLLRAKGKDLWAVRLFDPANDATERRAKRTARRRLQRRKQRIALLQGVFAPYMEDNLFFIRLNNSAFYVEDKNKDLKSRFSLFDDENFNDVNFYDKKNGYPTIFHLRQALIEHRFTEKPDLRLYYLAIHHIIKYRGHFLFEGESVGDIRNAKKLFENYNAVVSELFEDLDLSLPVDKADEFRNLALSQKTLNDKKKEAISLLGGVSPERKEIISFIIGATASPAKLFGEEYAEKYKEEKTFSFRDINDETFEGKREIYEDDHYALLESLRAIYNFTVFEKVLGGYNNVSDSMVAIYKKHAADLKDLKDLLKLSNNQDIYYKIFRSKKETANYANYVGYSKSNGKKFKLKSCKYDDFLKFLKKT